MTVRRPTWSALDLSGAPGDAPAVFCADLTPESLLAAYRRGLFPMPAADDFARSLNEALFEDRVFGGAIAVLGEGRPPTRWPGGPRIRGR